MAISQRGLTLDEFLRLPEEEPELEYQDGVVTQKVSPRVRHSRLQGVLVQVLNGFAETRRLGLAFPELRTTYSGSSLVPDVALYRWERLPRDSSGEFADDALEPPDIAVEIASPGQSLRKLSERWRWYVEHGVGIALLVDSDARLVSLFRAGAQPQALRGDDPVDLSDVMPGFQLTVDELFGSLTIG